MREPLTNVGKHTDARHLQVDLVRRNDRIVLTITDDGCGFDPDIVAAALAEGHIGLGSLRGRFDAMDGHMAIDSAPGRGATVTVASPREP